jgi:hypothetical protein
MTVPIWEAPQIVTYTSTTIHEWMEILESAVSAAHRTFHLYGLDVISNAPLYVSRTTGH